MTAPNVNKDSLICRSRKSSFKKYLFFVLFRAQTREFFLFLADEELFSDAYGSASHVKWD